MRRVIPLVLLILLALVGFYGVWPALSLRATRTALQTGDEAALAAKVDFPAVRASLKPAATAQMDKALDQLAKSGGIGGVLGGQIKDQLKDQLVDGALQTLVTPERLIRMYAEGQDIKELMARLKSATAGGEQGKIDAGKLLGELFGGKKGQPSAQPAPAPTPAPAATPASAPAGSAAEPKSKYSLANVKGFGMRGPAALWIGVAKDPAAGQADAVVDLAFTGGTWKIVGLTPRL